MAKLPLDSLQTDLLIIVFCKLSNRALCRFRRTSSFVNSLIERYKKTVGSRCLSRDIIGLNLQNDDKNWDSFYATRIGEGAVERLEIDKNLSGIWINTAPLCCRETGEEQWPLLIKAFKNLELTYDVLDCAKIPDDYLAEIISLSKARQQNLVEYQWTHVEGVLKELQKINTKNLSKTVFTCHIENNFPGFIDLLKGLMLTWVMGMPFEEFCSLISDALNMKSWPDRLVVYYFEWTNKVKNANVQEFFIQQGIEAQLVWDMSTIPVKFQQYGLPDRIYKIPTATGHHLYLSSQINYKSTSFILYTANSEWDEFAMTTKLEIREIYEDSFDGSESTREQIVQQAYMKKYFP